MENLSGHLTSREILSISVADIFFFIFVRDAVNITLIQAYVLLAMSLGYSCDVQRDSRY